MDIEELEIFEVRKGPETAKIMTSNKYLNRAVSMLYPIECRS